MKKNKEKMKNENNNKKIKKIKKILKKQNKKKPHCLELGARDRKRHGSNFVLIVSLSQLNSMVWVDSTA